MLYNLLSAEQTRFADFGEVGLYALIGFLVVFVGISFLILVVWLVGKLMSQKNGKGEPKKEQAKAVEQEEVSEIAIADANTEEFSDELVAVITAAIMAYYEKNNPKCEFVVKRIKRI